MKPRDDILVDLDIGVEEPQPAGRIIAIGGAPGLFVGAGGNHHQRGALQLGVIAVPQLDSGRKCGAVLNVGHQPPRPLPIAVQDDDFACTAPHDEGR